MKKILIVAYYFPPVAASGAMRPAAFCKFLLSRGWSPRVLTTDPLTVFPPHHIDQQLSGYLRSAMQVDSVPHGQPLKRLIAWRDKIKTMLHKRLGKQSNEGGVSRNLALPNGQGGVTKIGALKNLILDWGFEFPDPQCAWFRRAVAFARRLPQTEIPDIVFATGGPWTSLLVGKRIAEHWGVPFIADYRDPWTSNPYCSFSSSFLNTRAGKLERSVCKTASRVIANTSELQIQLEEDYPCLAGKIVTITNGFDPDNFGLCEERKPKGKVKARLELCHFGTVYGKRRPTVLLQALADLYQTGRLKAEQFCLKFVGAWEVTEPRCEDLAQFLEKVNVLKREAPVPHEACLRQMAEADALLVIQPDSPLQIPGKIYEYIAARRPLLLVGGEGATANLVRRHGLGMVCSNNEGSIVQMLLDLIEGRQQLPRLSPHEVDRFSYRRLTDDLVRLLEEVNAERLLNKAMGH